MFNNKLIMLVIACLLLSWITSLAAHSEKHLRLHEDVIKDATSVSDAVGHISNILEQQGYDIFAVVDHAANAASVGLELGPTQLILFSDRRRESKLIRASQTLAIELPLKILVWEDDDESINHFYNGPGYLVDRHQLRMRDRRFAIIAKTVRQFGELDNGLITVDSPFSVEQTISNLKQVIESLADKGFRIPFVIDFLADNQHAIDHLSPAMLLIFGNPNVGTPLMLNQRRVGVDLPQKFLVWEDQYGQTKITYNDIYFLAKRHDLQDAEKNLENISNALANFVKLATQEEVVN